MPLKAADNFVSSIGGLPLKACFYDPWELLSQRRMRTVRASVVGRVNDMLAMDVTRTFAKDRRPCQGHVRFIFYDTHFAIFRHAYAHWKLTWPWPLRGEQRFARIWVDIRMPVTEAPSEARAGLDSSDSD